METYFTFPDAALRYDCAACGQRCCRGKGFALGPEELLPLLKRAPRLSPFLRLRPGGSLYATDFRDGCFFLAGDGRCGLEVDHGRAHKPATCRLFPFNRVYRVGDVRIIDHNATLCPLEAAPGSDDAVRHADLLAELATLEGSPLIDVPLPAPPELAEDWLAGERAAALDPLADPALLARWARLYGLDPQATLERVAAVAPRVRLLAPSLRLYRLFRRDAAPYPVELRRLPLRLLALALLGALADPDASLEELARRPSLRSLCELWEGQAAVLDVLSRYLEPVRLAAPSFAADLPPLLLPAIGAFLGAAFRARAGAPLGDLVEAAAAALPEPGTRALALALAATQLGSLAPA